MRITTLFVRRVVVRLVGIVSVVFIMCYSIFPERYAGQTSKVASLSGTQEPEPPETNLEMKRSWIQCIDHQKFTFPKAKRKTAWVVVLSSLDTLYSIQLTDKLAVSSHNVLLVLSRHSKAILVSFAQRFSHKSLQFLDIEDEDVAFSNFINTNAVDSVHMAFSSQDFDPVNGASMNTNIFRKMITLLSLVGQSKVNVYLHSEKNRQRHFYATHFHMDRISISVDARKTVSKENLHGVRDNFINTGKFRACASDFDYREYYDVFMKSVDIYIFTFQNIYDLQVIRVLH